MSASGGRTPSQRRRRLPRAPAARGTAGRCAAERRRALREERVEHGPVALRGAAALGNFAATPAPKASAAAFASASASVSNRAARTAGRWRRNGPELPPITLRIALLDGGQRRLAGLLQAHHPAVRGIASAPRARLAPRSPSPARASSSVSCRLRRFECRGGGKRCPPEGLHRRRNRTGVDLPGRSVVGRKAHLPIDRTACRARLVPPSGRRGGRAARRPPASARASSRACRARRAACRARRAGPSSLGPPAGAARCARRCRAPLAACRRGR